MSWWAVTDNSAIQHPVDVICGRKLFWCQKWPTPSDRCDLGRRKLGTRLLQKGQKFCWKLIYGLGGGNLTFICIFRAFLASCSIFLLRIKLVWIRTGRKYLVLSRGMSVPYWMKEIFLLLKAMPCFICNYFFVASFPYFVFTSSYPIPLHFCLAH